MLYISLTLSVVLLGAVNLIVVKWRNPVPATIGLGVGFSILPICLMFFSPAVLLQALVLTLLLFILLVPNRGRRLYLPLSCVATLVIYALLLVPFIEKRRSFARNTRTSRSRNGCRADRNSDRLGRTTSIDCANWKRRSTRRSRRSDSAVRERPSSAICTNARSMIS